MTVYQVRSLFFTFALERNRHAKARSACRVFNEAVVSCRCRLPCCAGHPRNSQVATTSGHTCLILGNEVRLSIPAALANSFVIGSYSHFGIGIEFASSSIERGGSHWPGTDSAANQFGAHVTERTKPRAAHFRCLWPVSAPRAFVLMFWIGERYENP